MMMKKRGSICVIIGFICFLFLLTSAYALPTARLELVGPTTIYVGDSFDIEVYVDGVDTTDEVLAFGFDVDYDTTLFSYDGATVNSVYFSDDSSLFTNTEVAGSVLFPGPGPNGDDILLASLSFTALTPGVSYAGILSDTDDPNEGLTTWLYYYDIFTGIPGQIDLTSALDVTVASAAPVPEPATMVLVGAGIFCLAGFRKKLMPVK